MSAELAVVLLSAVLEDDDLDVLSALDDLRADGSALDVGSADDCAFVLAEKDDLVEGYDRAVLGVDLLALELVALGNSVLLSALFNNCVHSFVYLLRCVSGSPMDFSSPHQAYSKTRRL